MSEYFKRLKIPKIYAYKVDYLDGHIKVGYTTRTAEERVREQMENVKMPTQNWEILLEEVAMRENGTYFTDKDIHKRLKEKNIPAVKDKNDKNTEWFQCSIDDVRACILAEQKGISNRENRKDSFPMRPEQRKAVEKTARYFRSVQEEGIVPHFLWNAKMRFGKTFASYQLAKEMGWKKVLVLTFKPAVMSAWREDLQSHIDFEGWQFVSNKEGDMKVEELDRKRPFVYFGSFQDHLGLDKKTGGIKAKNEWIHEEEWDCVIFDEYHYGAWRDKSKGLFSKEEEERIKEIQAEQEEIEKEDIDKTDNFSYFDEELLPITTKHYLYLSGTPFRAIATGEFIEEQIYNWTYSDEQKAKKEWKGEDNPYLSLPRMVIMTYQIPEEIQQIAIKGQFNEFDLNEFFSAEGTGASATFKNEEEVQKWLSLIRGQFVKMIESDLKQGNKKPPMPFSDIRLLRNLQHTFWFLPNVASCHAMANLLKQKQNTFFNDYKVIVCAGTEAGIGESAYQYTMDKMGNPLETKTITLSCGKLTTGVSVPAWSGIFMLRNSSSPETYFQSIFRVQTPWVVKNPNGDNPNEQNIVKDECYVFDFAPNRALSQVASYSGNLNINTNVSAEEKVAELINFLPILAYDGNVMKEVNASEILDIASRGTTATLLARRWESALLVNVDDGTLSKLLKDDDALSILENIEGFRNLRQDLEIVINQSDEVKKIKRGEGKKNPPNGGDGKGGVDEAEKEYKSKRKEIQDKLIKFATRIPVFMYLSEHREETLKDVITLLEPELFKKVTGIEVTDFEYLAKLGLFNDVLMNDAVLKFKHYEDSSLAYTGKKTYDGLRFVGAYDTIVPIIGEEE